MVLWYRALKDEANKTSFVFLAFSSIFYRFSKFTAKILKRPFATLFIWVYDFTKRPLHFYLFLHEAPRQKLKQRSARGARFRRRCSPAARGKRRRSKRRSQATSGWSWCGRRRPEACCPPWPWLGGRGVGARWCSGDGGRAGVDGR